MDPRSPALAAARRLARASHAPILPVDRGAPAPDCDGAVLLADDRPSAGLLAALPRAEALVLWLADTTPEEAVELLEGHGVEHGSIDRVELPEPGVLAVLTSDDATAEAHAAALRAPERPFRALAIMPAFNEADVIFHAIGALVAEGVDVYLIDHESTDGTVEAAKPWLGRGLVRIERFLEEAGELLNFRPTPQDAFVDGADVRLHLRHYEPPGPYDVLQIKAWRSQPAVVDLVHHGGHDVLFAGKRVFPVPFLLRHYPIRSAEHGRRKVLAERIERFASEERAGGWHVQYDHYADGADYLHERETLTEYDGDRVRAALLARSLRELLVAPEVGGRRRAIA